MKADRTTDTFRMICLGISGIVLTLASATQVGAEVKSRASATSDAVVASAESKTSEKLNQTSLRCWQDGTLLFEESNLSEQTLAGAKQILVFERDSQAGRNTVFLIETGSATCLFKKA